MIPYWRQAIIPSYRFHCHGNVTEWGLNIESSNGNGETFLLELQVWRPSFTVGSDGCYRLVGSNRFTSVAVRHGIARVTPHFRNRIRFQPGDVLGFYAESSKTSSPRSRGVMSINDFEQAGDRGYEQTEEVWYGNIDGLSPSGSNCPFPAGINGVLNSVIYAAPVISVSIGEYYKQPL